MGEMLCSEYNLLTECLYMPSITCRDAGMDCDYFYEHDDAMTVLIEDLKHTEEVHGEAFKEMTEKYKPWEVVTALLRYIKR